MNRFLICTSTCALTLGMASIATAQTTLDSGSFSASVVGEVERSGFSQSASVGVSGFGAGAASVSNTTAAFRMLGTATAGRENDEAFAGSGIASEFDLDRDVQISGSSIGPGAVFATGNSTGLLGFSGLATGTSETGVIRDVVDETDPLNPIVIGEELFRKSADSSSAGGIDGGASTSLGLEMIGTSSNFIGALATENSTQDQVAVLGSNFVTSADTSIVISPFEDTTLTAGDPFDGLFDAAAAGETGFNFEQTADGLDLSVANLGGGSIQASGDVKGFFGGGFGSSAATDFGVILDVEAPAP